MIGGCRKSPGHRDLRHPIDLTSSHRPAAIDGQNRIVTSARSRAITCCGDHSPVVPTCGTILHGISRWAHYHLWKLIHLIPSYIKDCIDVKEKLEALGPLPPGTRLFIMDATAMYTNIDTKHGMYILRQFLNLVKKTNYQLIF